MDNLGRTPTTSDLLPPVPAPPPSELPAGAVFCGGIVFVPFDGSTGVEGTVDPTLVSSPDAAVHGTLSAGLKKAKQLEKSKLDETQKKYSIAT